MFTPFAFIQPITTAAPIAPLQNYLLIGGVFTLYNAPALGGIVKIDSTGSLDPSFNMGIGLGSGGVTFITQQPDGKYLVGASNMFAYSGSSSTRIFRANQNGTFDSTFNSGTGFDNQPNNAATNPDNSNVIVGQFTTYSGSSVNSIVKVTPSGTIDTTFNTGFGFNSTVLNSISRQPDGKFIVVGTFSQYSSSNNYITRTNLSGSRSAGPGSGFNTGVGFNGQVNTLVTQSDGKILVGGNFTTYSGSSNINFIVRLNTDGTRDTTFNIGTGFNTTVNNISLQSDGKMVCVGNFTSYSGSTTNRIVRINTDGTRDTTFNVGTGFDGTGVTLAIQSDNKILAAGSNIYSGSTVNRFVRINTNGTRDTTFNIGTGFNGVINRAIIQPDGRIICGGNFTTYSGSSTNTTRIIRLNTDGTQDTSFVTGTGYGGEVFGLAFESGSNKIVVCGNFSTYQGLTTNNTRLNRLLSNGNQDTSFVTGAGVVGTFSAPTQLSIEFDGKIYLGTFFTTYSGSTVNRFARINPSGTLDTSFQYSTPNQIGFNTTVRIVFITGSNIYYGGDFTSYQGTTNIVRINPDGTQDNTLAIGNGFQSGGPTAVLAQTDGKILVGGQAQTPYSGSTANSNLNRLNASGSLDSTFNVGTGPNGHVITVVTESSGKIVIAGQFTSYNSVSSNRIVRITNSGSRDASFNIGTGLDNYGASIATGQVIVSPDNSVYVASNFTSYSGSLNANRIVKIQPSGAIDTTFITATSSFNNTAIGFNAVSTALVQSGSSVVVGGFFSSFKSPVINRGAMIDLTGALSSSFNIGATGFNGVIQTFATQSDGKILAGGGFTSYSGSTINRIIRINTNGTIDTTFNVGTGANGNINDIRVQDDGKIIIMGILNTYSGSAVASNMTRLNTNGTIDTTYNLGFGFSLPQNVFHSALQPDQKLIAVGPFTSFSGSTSNRIVRINTSGTRDTTFNIGTGFNGDVEAVILQPDGKIICGGAFTTYSGSSINRIIRINTDGTRDTTFNPGTGFGGSIYALALQPDNKIICTSVNTTYSGSAGNYIIRINPSGTFDNTFNANLSVFTSTTSATRNSLAIGNDGKIYWGNAFTTFSGSIPNRIVRLNTSGSVDETFNQAFPNFVNSTGKGANNTINAILLL
jgi:uncharacterized delta-60 repeat protein